MQGLNPWLTTYLPALATTIVAVATVVLVVLNYRYVRLTGRLVDESRKSREPSVTVDFEIRDRSLRLVVVNHGLSPAKNVRIAVLKDISWLQTPGNSQGLIQSGPVKDGISYLTPSRILKYYLGHPRWVGSPDDEMEASLKITFENEIGTEYQHLVNFDFRQLRKVHPESFKDSPLAIADAIRESERERWSRESSDRMLRNYDGLARRRCPMCGELIPSVAKKCSHCLEMLDDSSPKSD